MITKTTPADQGRCDAQGSLVGGGPIQTAADLRDRIRRFAATEQDPARVAQLVLGSLLTPDEHRLIAEIALPSLVRVETAYRETAP